MAAFPRFSPVLATLAIASFMLVCLPLPSTALKCYICNNCRQYEITQSRPCPPEESQCMVITNLYLLLIQHLNIYDTMQYLNSIFNTKPRSEALVRMNFRSVVHPCEVYSKKVLRTMHTKTPKTSHVIFYESFATHRLEQQLSVV